MENLDKSQFIVLLETSLNRRLLSPEQKTLDAAYEDYIDLLHGLTVQSCKSSLDLLHELARLQSCLMRLQERIVEKESPQVLLLKSALLLTNFEIRLVFTRVRYPSIAAPVSVEVPKSPLFLSEQFTPTDNGSASLRSHTPHRRHTDRSGDTCRCAFRNFQRPYQQPGAVPPYAHQPKVASDAFSRHPAQQSDCLQPAIGSLFLFSITLRGFISRSVLYAVRTVTDWSGHGYLFFCRRCIFGTFNILCHATGR